MAKIKHYAVYYAGGDRITTVTGTCPTAAAKSFICKRIWLGDAQPYRYKVTSPCSATITADNNHTFMANFVLMEI